MFSGLIEMSSLKSQKLVVFVFTNFRFGTLTQFTYFRVQKLRKPFAEVAQNNFGVKRSSLRPYDVNCDEINHIAGHQCSREVVNS